MAGAVCLWAVGRTAVAMQTGRQTARSRLRDSSDEDSNSSDDDKNNAGLEDMLGPGSNRRLDPAAVRAAVSKTRDKLPCVITEEDAKEWDDWEEHTPTSLDTLPADKRAKMRMPMKHTAQAIPSQAEERKQVEFIRFEGRTAEELNRSAQMTKPLTLEDVSGLTLQLCASGLFC